MLATSRRTLGLLTSQSRSRGWAIRLAETLRVSEAQVRFGELASLQLPEELELLVEAHRLEHGSRGIDLYLPHSLLGLAVDAVHERLCRPPVGLLGSIDEALCQLSSVSSTAMEAQSSAVRLRGEPGTPNA